MSALLDSLAAGFEGDGARRAILHEALHAGLPGPRSEAWKYTSLRALERRAFGRAGADAIAIDASLLSDLLSDIPAPRLVFVNGRHQAALSDLAGVPAGLRLQPASGLPSSAPCEPGAGHGHADEVFANLNRALAQEGVLVRIEDNVDAPLPLHLVFVGTPASGDVAWHLSNALEIGARVRATIVEHHLGAGGHAHLGNSVSAIRIGAGARLRHARVQDDSARGTSLLRTDVVVSEHAEYRRIDLELGSALSRHELNVRLEGIGGRLVCNGVLLGTGRGHLDTRLGVEHLARDTACDLLWRGLGAGRSRAVFHGGITIHHGADGSDANLSNKNLLLSANAEIDTQPVLVIHADEVKAAHGATVGQVDPTAVFYLRSRGLPEPEARRLLTAAFCREALACVEDLPLRGFLQARLDAALAGLETP